MLVLHRVDEDNGPLYPNIRDDLKRRAQVPFEVRGEARGKTAQRCAIPSLCANHKNRYDRTVSGHWDRRLQQFPSRKPRQRDKLRVPHLGGGTQGSGELRDSFGSVLAYIHLGASKYRADAKRLTRTATANTMGQDYPVLIDDIAVAAERLSPLGRNTVGNAALNVREVILQRAERLGWRVVNHGDFASWIARSAEPDCHWVVCDPLLEASSLSAATTFRLTRVYHATGWEVEPQTQVDATRWPTVNLGIIDDVANTGKTFRFLAGRLADANANIQRLLLCCATSRALSVLAEFPDVELGLFVEGSHRAIHLRDACPYLPFAGRPSALHRAVQTPAGPVQVRMPSLTRKSGLWAALLSEYDVLSACVRARSESAARISEAIGRPARVADLVLVGPQATLPAYSYQQVTADTLLTEIA